MLEKKNIKPEKKIGKNGDEQSIKNDDKKESHLDQFFLILAFLTIIIVGSLIVYSLL